jgi:hypothetical protein
MASTGHLDSALHRWIEELRPLEQSWHGTVKYWKTRPELNRCLQALPGQCRRTATEPRLSSVVQVHSAISVSAPTEQEKRLISVEPCILCWYPICTSSLRERRFGGYVQTSIHGLAAHPRG